MAIREKAIALDRMGKVWTLNRLEEGYPTTSVVPEDEVGEAKSRDVEVIVVVDEDGVLSQVRYARSERKREAARRKQKKRWRMPYRKRRPTEREEEEESSVWGPRLDLESMNGESDESINQ